MWRTWMSLGESSDTNPLFPLVLGVAAGVLVLLVIVDMVQRSGERKRKRVSRKLPSSLANPMELPRRREE